MSTSKAKSFAKATGKLALAATVAALGWRRDPSPARLPPATRSARRARRPCKRAAARSTSGVMRIGPA